MWVLDTDVKGDGVILGEFGGFYLSREHVQGAPHNGRYVLLDDCYDRVLVLPDAARELILGAVENDEGDELVDLLVTAWIGGRQTGEAQGRSAERDNFRQAVGSILHPVMDVLRGTAN